MAEYDYYSQSLLHFEGSNGSTTFTDELGNTWTPNGGVAINTGSYKFGSASAYFDGTDDYITTPDSDGFNVGSEDFTIDFWIKRNSIPAQPPNIPILGQNSAADQFMRLVFDASNNVACILILTSGSSVTPRSAAITDTTTWHHVAIVRYGNSLKAYTDGVGGTNVNVTGLAFRNSSQVFSIGKSYITETANFHGYIDEFRFSKGIARWTANFTPPTTAYVYVEPFSIATPKISIF